MTDEELGKQFREFAQDELFKNDDKSSKHRNRKGWFSKGIVLLCIALVVIYTIICMVLQFQTGNQPEPQLTISFFGFVAVELWNLSKIKRDKERSDK